MENSFFERQAKPLRWLSRYPINSLLISNTVLVTGQLIFMTPAADAIMQACMCCTLGNSPAPCSSNPDATKSASHRLMQPPIIDGNHHACNYIPKRRRYTAVSGISHAKRLGSVALAILYPSGFRPNAETVALLHLTRF
jgi:hypothetical protein